MELKISNKITRKINNLKWKWDLYQIRLNMWKVGFNLRTMNMRIALNPKIIKLKVEGRLNQIGWKLYRIKKNFRTWRRKEKVVMCASVLKATVLSLLVIYLFAFMFDITLLSIAHCFGFMMDWKVI